MRRKILRLYTWQTAEQRLIFLVGQTKILIPNSRIVFAVDVGLFNIFANFATVIIKIKILMRQRLATMPLLLAAALQLPLGTAAQETAEAVHPGRSTTARPRL